MMLTEWILVISLTSAMMAALVLPGYFWVRASVRSSLVAISLAPALTFGFVTLVAQLWSATGIPWNRMTVLPVLALISVAGVLFWRQRRSSNPEVSELYRPAAQPPLVFDAPASHAYRILSLKQRRLMWVLIGVGWLLAALPTFIIADPTNPSQQWDAVFHVNGVWHLLQHQDAGWFHALVPMYSGEGEVYYPAGWHTFLALFATPTTITQAAHASSLMAMLVWVAGCAALTSVVATSRTATLASPVIAGMMLSMPADALTMYVQWPHATAVAALPGVIAGALIWGRRLVRSSENNWRDALVHWPLGLELGIAILGLAHIHASALFAFSWTLVFPLLGACYLLIKQRLSTSRGTAIAAALIAVIFVAVPIYLLTTPHLQGMGNYPRRGISWSFAFLRALVPQPPFAESIGLIATGTTFTLMILVAVNALIRRSVRWTFARSFVLDTLAQSRQRSEDERTPTPDRTPAATSETTGMVPEPTPGDPGFRPGSPSWERLVLGPRPAVWLIPAYLLWVLATFVAYSPEDTIRTFWLSPWYMDPRRIMGVVNMVMVPLIAIAFTSLVTWLRSNRSRHSAEDIESSSSWRIATMWGTWLVVITLCGAMDARLHAATYVFDPDNLGKPGMVTTQELAMIKRIPTTLPDNAYILGDPIAGAAYVESIGQRRAFFPQLTTSNTGSEFADLYKKKFKDIHTDPRICQGIRHEGITHVYLDKDSLYYSFKLSDRSPGLYGVDVSRGFELVDSGDSAAIYRITACD